MRLEELPKIYRPETLSLMDRALEPDGPQPELLARTLRKLLAAEPPERSEP